MGVFPCIRENKLIHYQRPDNCIFGTVSTIFILNELKSFLSDDSQELIDNLTQNAQKAYSQYQNKDGLKTYNFWKTMPSQHFPNGYILKYFKHFKLPDDIDDTALIYLTQKNTLDENIWLKEKLRLHTNNSKIYSTWFGKNMPIEHDVCALSNLMYWIFENKLPLNEFDAASLLHLQNVILSKDFIKKPFKAARHYANTPLIIYHYARLMGKFKIAQLEKCRKPLIEATLELLQKEKGMNKVILLTSLLKLQNEDFNINYFPEIYNIDKNDTFYSFIGALLAPYSQCVLQKLAPHALFRMNWKCTAHQLALRLEYKVLKQQKITNSS